MAIGAEADADDAGPQRRHLFRREAAGRERAGAITLGEDVRLLQERLHRLDSGGLPQVDPGAALAVPGVHQQFGLIGQVRGGDVQYIGAVLRQHAAAGRTGQHAREVEGAHARQRPFALRQRLGRRVADLHDVDQRQLRHGNPVRRRVPFVAAARQAAHTTAVGNRLLDREPVPFGDGGGQRFARVAFGAGNAQRAGAMVRMVGVDEHVPAVARRIVAGQRIPRHRPFAVAQDVGVGAQRSGGGGEVDRDLLGPAGLQPPQIGDREADGTQRRGAGGADAPRRLEHRIAVPGEGEPVVGTRAASQLAQDGIGQVVVHLPPAMILVSRAMNSFGQVMCGLWLVSSSWQVQPASLRARSANWRNGSPGPLRVA